MLLDPAGHGRHCSPSEAHADGLVAPITPVELRWIPPPPPLLLQWLGVEGRRVEGKLSGGSRGHLMDHHARNGSSGDSEPQVVEKDGAL